MQITHKGKEIELVFGFKFLKVIDKKLGIDMDGASIGQGVSLLPVGLSTGNPVTIGHVILAATSHLKKSFSDKDVDEILDDIAENVGLEEFGQDILEELGKRAMTRNLVEIEEQEDEKKNKKKK